MLHFNIDKCMVCHLRVKGKKREVIIKIDFKRDCKDADWIKLVRHSLVVVVKMLNPSFIR